MRSVSVARCFMVYVLCPFCVEHLQVFLHNANFLFLMSLVEIFQDDGNVHVDDNHVVDDDEGDKVDDGHKRVATIPVWQFFKQRVAIWWGDQQWVQHIIPASRRDQPESLPKSNPLNWLTDQHSAYKNSTRTYIQTYLKSNSMALAKVSKFTCSLRAPACLTWPNSVIPIMA